MRVESFVMDPTWKGVATAARHVEALGFDSMAVPEISSDPYFMAAAALAATERLRVRTAVAVAFPRSPMVVALMVWDLQRNSGGRFGLGLGTQVKGHNERRFSVPWPDQPAVQLREYVEALRAIWRTWRTGAPLAYSGKYYQFTLMTPEFVPPPLDVPDAPVYIAAVRPAMLRLAGRVCDGVRLHGFCTRKYLEDVVLPSLEQGLTQAGRSRDAFEICGGGFIATGRDEEALARMREMFRYRIAFYGSTRSYHPVFAVHGWEDLGMELHRLSKLGQWDEMAKRITDDVLDAFCVTATYERLAPAVAQRFGGLVDQVELGLPDLGAEDAAAVLSGLRGIPHRFSGTHAPWG